VVDVFVDFYSSLHGHVASVLDQYTSEALYTTFVSSNSSAITVFQDLNLPKKALAVNYFIFSSFEQLLTTYIDMFNLLAAVAINDVTSRHERFISSQNNMSIRSLLTFYDQMCTKVDNINAINSRVIRVFVH